MDVRSWNKAQAFKTSSYIMISWFNIWGHYTNAGASHVDDVHHKADIMPLSYRFPHLNNSIIKQRHLLNRGAMTGRFVGLWFKRQEELRQKRKSRRWMLRICQGMSCLFWLLSTLFFIPFFVFSPFLEVVMTVSNTVSMEKGSRSQFTI